MKRGATHFAEIETGLKSVNYRISSKERPGRSFKNQLARGGAQSRGHSFEGGAHLKFRVFWGRSFYFVDI